MHSDPIADLLTRIRNGAQARLVTVEVPHSKIKVEICKILQEEGYIKGYEISSESQFPAIRIEMRYDASPSRSIIFSLSLSSARLRILSWISCRAVE